MISRKGDPGFFLLSWDPKPYLRAPPPPPGAPRVPASEFVRTDKCLHSQGEVRPFNAHKTVRFCTLRRNGELDATVARAHLQYNPEVTRAIQRLSNLRFESHQKPLGHLRVTSGSLA